MDDIKSQLQRIEERLKRLEDKMANVTGRPYIRGSVNKVLEINENFNLLSVLSRIDALESA